MHGIFFNLVIFCLRDSWYAFHWRRENQWHGAIAPVTCCQSTQMSSIGDTRHMLCGWRDASWHGAKYYFLPCSNNHSKGFLKWVSFRARKLRGQHHDTKIVPDKWSNEKYRRHMTLVLSVARFRVVWCMELFFTLLYSVLGTHGTRFLDDAKTSDSAPLHQ